MPKQWLIVVDCIDVGTVRRLPRGTGVLLLHPPCGMLKLSWIARCRGLQIALEGRHSAVRVHNLKELKSALLARIPLIALSPMFATESHPDWSPIPRMRAASFARMARRQLVALGGMNARRYATVAQLGFIGWAGISAFRT